MTKCKGCGIKLQNVNINNPGYTANLDNTLCERCFKITNYNKNDIASKNISNMEIISKINSKKIFTLFLCDIFNLSNENIKYYNAITNDKIFLITKIDLIPKNIKLDILKKRIQKIYKINEILFTSSINNYGISQINNYFLKYNKVLLCGPTSSGKSSLLNHLTNSSLTVSSHKNTTQDFITINYNDTVIIDSPGFNNDYIFDNINIKGQIKLRTIQLKKDYALFIDKYIVRFDKDVNITLYFDKSVIVKTKKVSDKINCNLKVEAFNDLIISNLGFIYINSSVNVFVNILDNIEVRKSIIGGSI